MIKESQKPKFPFSELREFFLWLLILAAVVGFSSCLQFHQAQITKIDDDAYYEYALSLVSHRDLNIYRPDDTFVSKTLNKPDMHDWGSGIFLVPFQLYTRILDLLSLDEITCFWSQLSIASTLANAVFFFLFIYFILQIGASLDLSFRRRDFFIFFTGTPMVWYLFFETSSNQFFFLAYLAFAINLALSCRKNNDFDFRFFILGATFAFSGLISDVGFIYWLGFIFYVLGICTSKEKKAKAGFYYFLGGILVILINFVNVQLKFGELVTPLVFFQKDYMGFIQKKFLFINALLGPQGILFLSPIYILCLYGLFSRFENGKKESESASDIKLLLKILAAVFVVSFAVKTAYWFPSSLVLGKNFLEHQIIFFLGYMFFVNKNSFLKKSLISFSILWNVLWLLRFYVDRPSFGLFYENLNLDFFSLILGHIVPGLISFEFFPKFLLFFIPWIFFIALLFALFKKFFNWAWFWKISCIVLVAFVSATLSNLAFNSTNTKFVANVPAVQNVDFYVAADLLKGLKAQRAIAQANQKIEKLDRIDDKILEIEKMAKENIPAFTLQKDFSSQFCRHFKVQRPE